MSALPEGKRERFCQLIVEGLMNVDAYVKSRPDSVMRRQTASQYAVELRKQPDVVKRIEELRAPVIAKVRKKFEYSLDHAMEEIGVAESLAQSLLQPAIMLQATKLKAQLWKMLDSGGEKRKENALVSASTLELLEVLAVVREKKRRESVPGVVLSESLNIGHELGTESRLDGGGPHGP